MCYYLHTCKCVWAWSEMLGMNAKGCVWCIKVPIIIAIIMPLWFFGLVTMEKQWRSYLIKQNSQSLGDSVSCVHLLMSAQVVISGSWDQTPCWVPHSAQGLLKILSPLSLCPVPHHACSLFKCIDFYLNIYLNKYTMWWFALCIHYEIFTNIK